MNTMQKYNWRTHQTIMMVCFLASLLVACASQPAPVTESAPPIQTLPTQEPPSPTIAIVPPTSTPETPVAVTAYEQLIGKWLSICGAGPCTLEFNADGTYRNTYVHKTETGVLTIESGKVTFADGILHFAAQSGCKVENHPDGYYTAALYHMDNNLYLRLTPAPNDECLDRQHMYTRDMKFLDK
jgi:hypothetical protein